MCHCLNYGFEGTRRERRNETLFFMWDIYRRCRRYSFGYESHECELIVVMKVGGRVQSLGRQCTGKEDCFHCSEGVCCGAVRRSRIGGQGTWGP